MGTPPLPPPSPTLSPRGGIPSGAVDSIYSTASLSAAAYCRPARGVPTVEKGREKTKTYGED